MKATIELTESEFSALISALASAPTIRAGIFTPVVEAEAEVSADDNDGWDDMGVSDEAPAKESPVVDEKIKANIEKGHAIFAELLETWLKNFDMEGTEQPDRAEAIRVVSSGSGVMPLLTYVGWCGGIQHAVDKTLRSMVTLEEKSLQALSDKVAATICQISSIYFPELAAYYEYRDIYGGRK